MARKVCIIDDDAFAVSAYEKKITQRGAECKSAVDGKLAWKLLEEYIPDVILLSLVLPKINGLELLKMIKKNSKLKNIPVYVTSNLGYLEDIKKCEDLGVSGFYITCDINHDEFIDNVLLKA